MAYGFAIKYERLPLVLFVNAVKSHDFSDGRLSAKTKSRISKLSGNVDHTKMKRYMLLSFDYCNCVT